MKISLPKHLPHWRDKKLWETIIFYAFMLIVFHLSQRGMKMNTYITMARQAFIPFIGFYFVQYINKRPLFSLTWIPSLLVGLAWFVFIPILQGLSIADITQWSPRRDIIFGLYLLLFFIILQSCYALLRNKCSVAVNKIAMVILTLLTLAALTIPLMEAGHFLLYHITISDSSIYAMQLTYPKEALGYIQTYISPVKLALIIAITLGIGAGIYKLYSQMSPLSLTKFSSILILLLPVLLFYLVGNLMNKTLFFAAWDRVTQYRQAQTLFTKDYDQRYQQLQLTTSSTLAQSDQGTVIVVIGESASRDYMKVYNPNFSYEDTPWLESRHNDPNFIVYNNAYTSYNQTIEALSKACTEMSQYNDKQFNQSITMIDIAKKAGYQTTWLTNQGGMSADDAAITLIMKTADQYKARSNDKQIQYDEDLVNLLKKIPVNQNNFVVIHLEGSHIPYAERYPQKDAVFDTSTVQGTYANTILYTDMVLKDIFNYAQQNMNLKVMLYFSDHGENLEHGHGPDVRTFDTLRIPMFLYLSPDYQQTYTDKFNLLKSRENTYFTNDMIYNTLSGILNAPSNHYDAKEDLSSPAYHFTRNNLWTFNHSVPINSDPTK